MRVSLLTFPTTLSLSLSLSLFFFFFSSLFSFSLSLSLSLFSFFFNIFVYIKTMATVTVFAGLNLRSRFPPVKKYSTQLSPNFPALSNNHGKSCFKFGPAMGLATLRRRPLLSSILSKSDAFCETLDKVDGEENKEEMEESSETLLYSFSPLPLMLVAALPGAGAVTSLFGPFVELVKSWNLPDWLVHWGHPGNMAVVLFAMGGYGTYLGFRIRFSDDLEEKAKAKDLHPKLLGGMFFFFALGATGGITSLLTSDKPIFESPHAVTGFIGLTLLTIQTILPTLFEGNPGLRNVHGIFGSGIITLFLVHAALGLQLGLSY